MLPNFLIIGAMKAGTSTLRDHLRDVEEVYIAPRELHFFSNDDNFARGLEWYETQFADGADRRAVGEKTPVYCTSPVAAERIRVHLPDAKFIWLFREPVARSYSHYWHSVQRGREPLSFAAAVREERTPVRGDRERDYLRRSRYAEQVELYLTLFPRNQFLFLLFEEMVRRPAVILGQVLEFLEIPGEHSLPAPRRSHPTFGPRSVKAQWLAARIFGRGERGWNVVQRINRRRTPGYPPMPQAFCDQLRDEFSASNRRLGELTGLDVSMWTSSEAAARRSTS